MTALRCVRWLLTILSLGSLSVFVLAEPRVSPANGEEVLREWNFDEPGNLQGWSPGGHLRDTQVAEGVLRTTVGDWDPILVHELFDPPLPTTPTQVIEIRLWAPRDGTAEFFWTNTTKTQYGGFSPEKHTPFHVSAGWHTYRVRPFWQAEGHLLRLRFDLPGLQGGEEPAEYRIDFIRIIELGSRAQPVAPDWTFRGNPAGWSLEGDGKLWVDENGLHAVLPPGSRLVAPPIEVTEVMAFAAFQMAVDEPGSARLIWASGKVNGLQSQEFVLSPGKAPRVYNIPLGGAEGWQLPIVYLGLEPTADKPVHLCIRWFKLSAEPAGPADLEIKNFFIKSALPRVGQTCELVAQITNRGGETVAAVRAKLVLPDGVALAEPASAEQVTGPIDYGDMRSLIWRVTSRREGPCPLKLLITHPTTLQSECVETFLPQLHLPKAEYVPPPQPVRGPYEVGVYYFPGWGRPASWLPLLTFPERRPVLGFYREGLPEVIDWQIKWAVEHGITFFCYDWYWRQGEQRLNHALHDGYFHARYRNLLKFCLLWANHFGPGEHSAEDNRRVCQYWIENYFRRPEYFQIDGRPLLVIFSVYSLKRDLGIEGTRQAIELWHRMTEEAGVGRILVAGCGTPVVLKEMKEMGFDAVTGYNWPRCGIDDRNWVPFAEVARNYNTLWWRPLAEAGLMPVITPVSAGWDSRPWHGERALVLTDCTPEAFEAHLRQAKQFVDETGQPKVLLVEAWNEFGEGSFCEPHKRYGFGHLEAIRRVFCPNSPAPQNFGPEDVGLPLPEFNNVEEPPVRTEWDFATPGDTEGWSVMMGLTPPVVKDGCLTTKSTSNDPALQTTTKLRASEFSELEIRVAIRSSKARDILQLFWCPLNAPFREEASAKVEVIADGEFHTYRLNLAAHPLWRGLVAGLRLDPCTTPNAEIRLDSLKFIRSSSNVRPEARE